MTEIQSKHIKHRIHAAIVLGSRWKMIMVQVLSSAASYPRLPPSHPAIPQKLYLMFIILSILAVHQIMHDRTGGNVLRQLAGKYQHIV